ncbi:MAG TPA: L,D-transpeptidase family protein [Thermoanaerobaculia bacterium]|nr:L,D-transpeptidase family protein [Thermoanaerobaculia bacterium]
MKSNTTPSTLIRRRGWLAVAALLPILAAGCQRDKPMPPQVSQILRETLEVKALPVSVSQQKERLRAWEEMRRFYQKRNFQPAWSDSRGPLPQAEALLAAIDPLAVEGLDPRRYRKEQLTALLPEGFPEEKRWKGLQDDPQVQRRVADLDAQLTYTFLTLAAHMAVGRLQPETLRVDWYTKPRNIDLDALLEKTLASHDQETILKTLRGLAPPNEEYARLRQALARYRDIANRGGWPEVPAGPDLKQGDTGPRVAALRARLAVTGDLVTAKDAPAATGVGFDQTLGQAVSRFQRRHGLEVTGKVDETTLEALNVPARARLRQIEANMERWRWMPSALGERYIWVNVPEFRMELMEGGRQALAMRVVVGKEQSKTPVFSDRMEYLELNPEWNLPDSIVENEILPAMEKNPGYLASHNMEVVPGPKFRLKQRPGPDNPLGKVKFMFPNQFDIYLHDTPADHLFDQSERDFSHGCIRLERPVELAEYLLKDDPKWTPEAIRAKLASGEQTSVPLPRPLPVHILYWTAWAEPDGTVQFRKDIYGHDERLIEALAKEPPVPVDLPAVRGDVRAAK